MKNKKTLAILIAVFIVLLGGAWFLYSRLGSDPASGQLVAQSTSQMLPEAPFPQSHLLLLTAPALLKIPIPEKHRPRISPYMIWTATRCACLIISESLLF